MKKIVITTIVLTLIIGVWLFYWYEWRPSKISKECYQYSQEGEIQGDKSFTKEQWQNLKKLQDILYKECLKEHGLEK